MVSAAAAGESRAERVLITVLLATAGLTLAIRALAIAEPLGIDQSLWASAARGMSRGQALYADVWEQRPPGIYFTYLSAFSLFGWRESTVAWLDLLASGATALLIFDVARTLAGRLTGALAAACYAVLTMPAWLYGYGGFLERSVCETFTVAWAALAASAAARLHRGSNRAFLLLSLVGLSTGIAVVYKPNAGLYLPAMALWLFCYWRPPGQVTLAARARPFVLIGVMAALPTIATIIWLAASGLIADARVAVVDFNRFYVASGVTLDAMGLAFANVIWMRMKTDPLWAAGGVGALLAIGTLIRERRLAPLPGLAVIWGAAAAFVIFVNGIRLFNAYFINALAPLALMAAWVIAGARGGSRWRQLVSAGTVALMVGLMFGRGGYVPRVVAAARANVDVLSGHLSRADFLERFGGYGNNGGYSARANEALATYIASHTTVDEKVFLFGVNGTAVYFLADRLIAHRFLRVNFFVPEVFPNPAFTRAAVVAELEKVRPRYVIFERVHTASDVGRQIDALPTHPDVAPWLERYALEAEIEDFSVYRRK